MNSKSYSHKSIFNYGKEFGHNDVSSDDSDDSSPDLYTKKAIKKEVKITPVKNTKKSAVAEPYENGVSSSEELIEEKVEKKSKKSRKSNGSVMDDQEMELQENKTHKSRKSLVKSQESDINTDLNNSTSYMDYSQDSQHSTKKQSHKSKKLPKKKRTQNDVYLVQIPKFIDPHDLKGVCISVSDEHQVKIGKRKYVTAPIATDLKKPIVFTKNGKCDLKLVRFLKHIEIQRYSKTESVVQLQDEVREVPFPEGLKIRHPMLGFN